MSLEKLLDMARSLPPGHVHFSNWPRLSGYSTPDKSHDPPRYTISTDTMGHLMSYFEEDIYFDLQTDFKMPKGYEDGVTKVCLICAYHTSFYTLHISVFQ